MRSRILWPHLLCLYWIWGSSYLANESALSGFPPCTLAALRCLAAGALFGLYCLGRGGIQLSRRETLGSLAVGGLLLGVGNAALLYGQQTVSPATASLLFATVGGWVALFSWLSGSPLSRLERVGLALGAAGLALGLLGSGTATGMAALLVASLVWAGGTVLAHRMSLPHTPDGLCVQYAGGTLTLLALAHPHLQACPGMPTVGAALAFVYLVAVCSVSGYAVHAYVVRNGDPAQASSYVYVTPAVALALQTIF